MAREAGSIADFTTALKRWQEAILGNQLQVRLKDPPNSRSLETFSRRPQKVGARPIFIFSGGSLTRVGFVTAVDGSLCGLVLGDAESASSPFIGGGRSVADANKCCILLQPVFTAPAFPQDHVQGVFFEPLRFFGRGMGCRLSRVGLKPGCYHSPALAPLSSISGEGDGVGVWVIEVIYLLILTTEGGRFSPLCVSWGVLYGSFLACSRRSFLESAILCLSPAAMYLVVKENRLDGLLNLCIALFALCEIWPAFIDNGGTWFCSRDSLPVADAFGLCPPLAVFGFGSIFVGCLIGALLPLLGGQWNQSIEWRGFPLMQKGPSQICLDAPHFESMMWCRDQAELLCDHSRSPLCRRLQVRPMLKAGSVAPMLGQCCLRRSAVAALRRI
ncbi:hypothetical protein Nepgr_032587 [Nepenthes gracilis]|uniref:Uncharacterized protein n=1 Tax=Nepenthes gracilis TaxID=150966 RepID=A0AAD3TK95_NEPGR|nr:hypothetical protein Nepgr_032587 [Nepenthes gracilis]